MVPAIRVKAELFPAPVGPIIPRHWPESSENVTPSATTIAPNRFRSPSTSRSADITPPSRPPPPGGRDDDRLGSAELRQELELRFDRDLRRRGVVDDQIGRASGR